MYLKRIEYICSSNHIISDNEKTDLFDVVHADCQHVYGLS